MKFVSTFSVSVNHAIVPPTNRHSTNSRDTPDKMTLLFFAFMSFPPFYFYILNSRPLRPYKIRNIGIPYLLYYYTILWFCFISIFKIWLFISYIIYP